jgi:dCMP deaminase
VSRETWDARWLDEAAKRGSWSKDRSRKVGAIIVKDDTDVVAGWNGFPRGIDDEVEERHQRPAKYLWSEHSERNAIYNAARMGRATDGCRIYQTMYPCAHCARALIQSGIVEVITYEPDWNDLTYAEEFAVTKEMLAEAGVHVRFVEGSSPIRANFDADTSE